MLLQRTQLCGRNPVAAWLTLNLGLDVLTAMRLEKAGLLTSSSALRAAHDDVLAEHGVSKHNIARLRAELPEIGA